MSSGGRNIGWHPTVTSLNVTYPLRRGVHGGRPTARDRPPPRQRNICIATGIANHCSLRSAQPHVISTCRWYANFSEGNGGTICAVDECSCRNGMNEFNNFPCQLIVLQRCFNTMYEIFCYMCCDLYITHCAKTILSSQSVSVFNQLHCEHKYIGEWVNDAPSYQTCLLSAIM